MRTIFREPLHRPGSAANCREEGWSSRRGRAWWRSSRPPAPTPITSCRSTIFSLSADICFSIESIRDVLIDEAVAHPGRQSGDERLEARGYRHAEGLDDPVRRVEYYINRADAAVGWLLQRHSGPIFPLIEDMFGQSIVEVQQQISATSYLPALATGLKVKEGSAAPGRRRTHKPPMETLPGNHHQHPSRIPAFSMR